MLVLSVRRDSSLLVAPASRALGELQCASSSLSIVSGFPPASESVFEDGSFSSTATELCSTTLLGLCTFASTSRAWSAARSLDWLTCWSNSSFNSGLQQSAAAQQLESPSARLSSSSSLALPKAEMKASLSHSFLSISVSSSLSQNSTFPCGGVNLKPARECPRECSAAAFASTTSDARSPLGCIPRSDDARRAARSGRQSFTAGRSARRHPTLATAAAASQSSVSEPASSRRKIPPEPSEPTSHGDSSPYGGQRMPPASAVAAR
mmetsp:Transcript_10350/g.33006  ORF Transcript_10350/g.33006 Transcript_10350/m.33006 type:complete len:265 (-) Transcript_10350:34-828(-)